MYCPYPDQKVQVLILPSVIYLPVNIPTFNVVHVSQGLCLNVINVSSPMSLKCLPMSPVFCHLSETLATLMKKTVKNLVETLDSNEYTKSHFRI
jgi:hypothetical protein